MKNEDITRFKVLSINKIFFFIGFAFILYFSFKLQLLYELIFCNFSLCYKLFNVDFFFFSLIRKDTEIMSVGSAFSSCSKRVDVNQIIMKVLARNINISSFHCRNVDSTVKIIFFLTVLGQVRVYFGEIVGKLRVIF